MLSSQEFIGIILWVKFPFKCIWTKTDVLAHAQIGQVYNKKTLKK